MPMCANRSQTAQILRRVWPTPAGAALRGREQRFRQPVLDLPG